MMLYFNFKENKQLQATLIFIFSKQQTKKWLEIKDTRRYRLHSELNAADSLGAEACEQIQTTAQTMTGTRAHGQLDNSSVHTNTNIVPLAVLNQLFGCGNKKSCQIFPFLIFRVKTNMAIVCPLKKYTFDHEQPIF